MVIILGILFTLVNWYFCWISWKRMQSIKIQHKNMLDIEYYFNRQARAMMGDIDSRYGGFKDMEQQLIQTWNNGMDHKVKLKNRKESRIKW